MFIYLETFNTIIRHIVANALKCLRTRTDCNDQGYEQGDGLCSS